MKPQKLLLAAALFVPATAALAQCPPVIMVQPSSQTVCAGTPVTFGVYATANTPLTYQWRKDGTDIPDATAATYQLPPVDSSDAGHYSVAATANDCGTTISSDAVLTVRGALASINSPVVCASALPATITVNAFGGTPPYIYSVIGPGGFSVITQTNATSNSISASVAGTYTGTVQDSSGFCPASASGTLTVVNQTTITAQPQSLTRPLGANVSFNISFSAAAPLTIQWFKNQTPLSDGGNVSGATTRTLALTGVSSADAASYKAVVTSCGSSATSKLARLAVQGPASPRPTILYEAANAMHNARITLSWPTSPTLQYQVQARNNLTTDPWQTVANIMADSFLASWTDPAPVAGSRFYRLVTPYQTTLFPPPQPAPGEPSCATCGTARPQPPGPLYVDLASGEFRYSTVDLQIKGRGIDFVWARSYHSRTGPSTDFGERWDHSYNIFVEGSGPNVILHNGAGRQDVFYPQPDGSFAADQLFLSLTRTGGVFTATLPDSGKWIFRALDGSPAAGKIACICDRNLNQITLAYHPVSGRLTNVTDTLGHNISVSYTPNGLISGVTDFANRQVLYKYQPDPFGQVRGILTEVVLPAVTGTPTGNDFPDGLTTRYTYADTSGHRLQTIEDAKRQVWLRNTYSQSFDPADVDYDHVVEQKVGGPGDFPTMFFYERVNTSFGYRTHTIVNDPVGNVKDYEFDPQNRCLRYREFTGRAHPGVPTIGFGDVANNPPVNPLRPDNPPTGNYETLTDWNTDSLPTSIVHPNGSVTEFVYESTLDPSAPARSRGNLRERYQLPGPRGAEPSMLFEQSEYDTAMGGCCGFNFVTKYTNARGEVTLHGYDAHGNLTNTLYSIPGISEERGYNQFGQMTEHRLPANSEGYRRTDTFTYPYAGPGAGYLGSSTTDTNGFAIVTTYERNVLGWLTRRVDARGGDTKFTYNQRGWLVRTEFPEVTPGSGIRAYEDYRQDANGNVIQIDHHAQDSFNNVPSNAVVTTTCEFEILNHPTTICREVADGQCIVDMHVWSPNRKLIKTQYGESSAGRQPANLIEFVRDERDFVFKTIRARGTADQSATQFDYNETGQLASTSEGLECGPRVSANLYDGFNRLVSSTDPMGNVTTNRYDANGNLTNTVVLGELVDLPGGANNVRLSEINFTYDPMDRLIQRDVEYFDPATQAPLADGKSTTQFFYADDSQIMRTVDDRGHETRIEYDTASRPHRVTDARGNSMTYEYDDNNNVLSKTDVEKSDLGGPDETYVTTATWDGRNRPKQITDNIGNVTQFAYDSRHNLTRTIDARGNQVLYNYDGQNRLTQTTRFLTSTGDGGGTLTGSVITLQTWDDSSRLTSQTDPNSNTTFYAYDPLNRVTCTVFADGTSNCATFNCHDLAATLVDANSNVVSYLYDLNNRPTNAAIAPGPGVSAETTFERYQHDGLSRLVRAEDDDSLVTRAYNSLSLTTRETLNGQTNISAYDAVGNKVACRYPGGRILTRTFDVLDRVQAILDAGSLIASNSYIGPTRLARRDFANGTSANYLYDGLPATQLSGDFGVRQIMATGHALPGGALTDSRIYKWNRTGDKSQRLHAGFTDTFAYDSLDRLRQTTLTPPAGSPSVSSYTLDGAGNRTFGPEGDSTGNYTMSAATPEPADRQMNQYSTTPQRSLVLNDRNGNLVGISLPDVQVLTYNYRDELVQYQNQTSGQSALYRYDALGRRIEKIVGGGGGTNRFFYDGAQEIEEQSPGGVTLATYVFGNYLDDAVQMKRGADTYFYHADDQYNVVALTDANGDVAERCEYDDFGAPAILDPDGLPRAASAIGNPLLFTGRRYDAETGLYWFRSRYLDPRIGRFTSRDTLGIWGDAANLGNAYTYVANNPGRNLDPFGEGAVIPGCGPVVRAVESASSAGMKLRRKTRPTLGAGITLGGTTRGWLGGVIIPYGPLGIQPRPNSTVPGAAQSRDREGAASQSGNGYLAGIVIPLGGPLGVQSRDGGPTSGSGNGYLAGIVIPCGGPMGVQSREGGPTSGSDNGYLAGAVIPIGGPMGVQSREGGPASAGGNGSLAGAIIPGGGPSGVQAGDQDIPPSPYARLLGNVPFGFTAVSPAPFTARRNGGSLGSEAGEYCDLQYNDCLGGCGFNSDCQGRCWAAKIICLATWGLDIYSFRDEDQFNVIW